MRLSVTPIPTIISTQTREEFSIDVLNQGVGPLIVQGISFVDKYGNRREAAIVEAEYQAIVGNIVLHDLEPPSAIAAGEKRSLIRFLPAEGNASEQLTNQALRADTDELKVVVKYTDVYETRFENYVYTVEKQDGADVFPVN
ncbi:hypothetical protein RA20_00645 [Leisingera sp. ANG-Vp]|nr:hypothetical protein RA20_00645 [Leisingera sp. ANG-Vp]